MVVKKLRVKLELATMLLARRMELDKEQGGIPGKMVVKKQALMGLEQAD
jgi:hypothetical protein